MKWLQRMVDRAVSQYMVDVSVRRYIERPGRGPDMAGPDPIEITAAHRRVRSATPSYKFHEAPDGHIEAEVVRDAAAAEAPFRKDLSRGEPIGEKDPPGIDRVTIHITARSGYRILADRDLYATNALADPALIRDFIVACVQKHARETKND